MFYFLNRSMVQFSNLILSFFFNRSSNKCIHAGILKLSAHPRKHKFESLSQDWNISIAIPKTEATGYATVSMAKRLRLAPNCTLLIERLLWNQAELILSTVLLKLLDSTRAVRRNRSNKSSKLDEFVQKWIKISLIYQRNE